MNADTCGRCTEKHQCVAKFFSQFAPGDDPVSEEFVRSELRQSEDVAGATSADSPTAD
ncbi:MAG: hypothetical protein WCG84_02200 [Candidatus Moraniibacteriota bacterium]